MDKLTAEKILGVQPGASRQEIKRAYAAMVRTYHPEEFPEEFQRIQEAYEVLTKGGGNTASFSEPKPREENTKSMEKDRTEEKREPEKRKKKPEEWEKPPQDNGAFQREEEFEKIEWKANEQERLRQETNIELGLKELEMMVNSKSLKHRLDSYEKFFQKPEYREICFDDRFVEGVVKILGSVRLKREVYEIFAREFHMREFSPEQLKPQARKLYVLLDAQCKLKKKKSLWNPGYLLVLGLLIVFRNLNRYAEGGHLVMFLMVVIVAGMYWGYWKLLRYYTRFRIHICYSIILTLSQFILLMTEAYTPIFGSQEVGDMLGASLFLVGVAYFIITLAVGLISKIRWSLRK